jgi:type 9 secretion system plug protein
MKKQLAFLIWIIPALCFCQDEGLRYEDYTYLDNIKSVKFHVEGLLLSMPIVNLRSNAALELSFDDLSPDYKQYVYSFVHCDADWQPSNLVETEYIDGFTEEVIDDYDYSFKIKSIYTHYYLYLPNEDMQFTKSGNYLLKVYENEDEKRLAMTRRFMVVEPVVNVIPNVVRPAMVSKDQTHQEIDFTVAHKGFEIRNPRQELSVTILQNCRWDNAITDLKPIFSRQEEQVYDYQDKIVFPAGKEFRYLDLRSLKYGSENIQYVEYINNMYEVSLYQDQKRSNSGYLEYEDINGNFVIGTYDEDDGDLESDYASVLFTLKSPSEMYDYDVYIFGGVSDWQLKPGCRMAYNPAINAYVGKMLLKQGYYNYLYAAVKKGTGEIDFEETEGDWFETKNNYTILVYYRPFGQRYDHLIGAYTFSSRL